MTLSFTIPIPVLVLLLFLLSSATIILSILRQFVRDAIAIRDEFTQALADNTLTLEEAEKILKKIDILVQNLNAGIIRLLQLRR